MVLEQYPDSVIVYVTDPLTGVQRGSKWPPTIAEIVSACDARLQYLLKLQGLRKKPEVPMLEGPPRAERPTLAQMKAKYGENWGLASALPAVKPPLPKAALEKRWNDVVKLYQAEPGRITRLVRLADEMKTDEDLPDVRISDERDQAGSHEE